MLFRSCFNRAGLMKQLYQREKTLKSGTVSRTAAAGMKTCKAGSIPARFNRGSQTPKIRHCQAGSGHASYKACGWSTGFSGSRLFNAKSGNGSAERKEKNMGTFMQAFERAAVKYAEYVKTKLMFSASIQEIKPGQEVFFREPEKEAEQLMREMQTLNQIAQTLKEKLGEDVIELDTEELENLQVTEAEIEEFNKKTVCFMERNEETGAVEIMPGNGGKIILNDTGQIKVFLKIVGSYLKGGTEDGRDKRMETMLAQTSREETEEVLDFMNTLDPYEKREFIGIMRGAKMVKAFQTAKQETAAV